MAHLMLGILQFRRRRMRLANPLTWRRLMGRLAWVRSWDKQAESNYRQWNDQQV